MAGPAAAAPPLRGPGQDGPLGAPLLRVSESTAASPTPGPGFLRRAAAWHGPHPTIVLVALLALASFACLADGHARASTAQAEAAVFAGAVTPVEGGVVEPGSHGGEARVRFGLRSEEALPTQTPMLLFMVALVLAGPLLCQHLGEKLVCRAFMAALRGLKRKRFCTDFRVGTVRAWVFLGRFAARGCLLHGPEGYQCDRMLLVRGLTADVSLGRLLRSLGADVEVHQLKLDGVDIVLEEGGSGGSNLRTALENLAHHDEEQLGVDRKIRVRRVIIRNVVVQVGDQCTPIADIQHNDFSKELGAETLDDIVAALASTLGTNAVMGTAAIRAS